MPLNKKRSESRLEGLKRIMRRRKLDVAVLFGQKNILSLVGVDCDNGALVIDGDRVRYTTDFRYVPAVRRTAPSLPVTDGHRDLNGTVLRFLRDVRPLRRIGFEGDVSASRYLDLAKRLPRTKFVDIGSEMLDLRAVKTPEEIARITAAEALNDRIWTLAQRDFRSGMTEKDLQRIIRKGLLESAAALGTVAVMVGDGPPATAAVVLAHRVLLVHLADLESHVLAHSSTPSIL